MYTVGTNWNYLTESIPVSTTTCVFVEKYPKKYLDIPLIQSYSVPSRNRYETNM